MLTFISVLQVLKEKNLIPESGSIANPMVLEERDEEVVEEEKEVVEEKLIRDAGGGKKGDQIKSFSRRMLRVGAEGDEVKAMQVCLPFY